MEPGHPDAPAPGPCPARRAASASRIASALAPWPPGVRRLARAACGALAAAALLGGCLEVEQHPPYAGGFYDGKPDDLPEKVFFNGDTQAWARHLFGQRLPQQHEYNRFGRDEVKPQ